MRWSIGMNDHPCQSRRHNGTLSRWRSPGAPGKARSDAALAAPVQFGFLSAPARRGMGIPRDDARDEYLARAVIRSFAMMAIGLASCGCQLVVHPFRDELAGLPQVTTASVEVVRASPSAEVKNVRGSEEAIRFPEDGSVAHWPTWFEDPYEENGSEDGKFAWTVEDYWQMLYWRGRFLVELAFWPISAVVEPPWRVMESDGILEKRCCRELHDARPVTR